MNEADNWTLNKVITVETERVEKGIIYFRLINAFDALWYLIVFVFVFVFVLELTFSAKVNTTEMMHED